jgi:hypothetical protein
MKHLVPATALIAYAVSKRTAELKAQAQYSQQLALELPDLRCAGLIDPRLLRTQAEDDED